MFQIINIMPIIKAHFKTLKEDTHNINIYILFLFMPALFSFILIYCEFVLSKTILGQLIVIFSIFIGFIINVLVLLINIPKEKIRIRNKLIEHLSYNSLYALILGLLILFISFLVFIMIQSLINYDIIISIISFVLYFLIFNFILTLLMISKRFFTIYNFKIKDRFAEE